jgi:hypothetical protein
MLDAVDYDRRWQIPLAKETATFSPTLALVDITNCHRRSHTAVCSLLRSRTGKLRFVVPGLPDTSISRY